MNEQMLQAAVIGYMYANKIQPKSEQEVQGIAQQVIQLKPQEIEQYAQLGIQLQQQKSRVKAKLGAKLNYLNKLKGICPEGSESYYFRDGGSIKKGCKPCMEKAEKGKKLKEKNSISQWKADRAKAKDEAARDSIAINKYNDQETIINKGDKGKFNPNKTNASGGATWEPDRSKYEKAKKNACGAKMKKK